MCVGEEEKQCYALKVLFYLFYPKKGEHFVYVYEEYSVSLYMCIYMDIFYFT